MLNQLAKRFEFLTATDIIASILQQVASHYENLIMKILLSLITMTNLTPNFDMRDLTVSPHGEDEVAWFRLRFTHQE